MNIKILKKESISKIVLFFCIFLLEVITFSSNVLSAGNSLSCNSFIRFINNSQNTARDIFFSVEQDRKKIVTVDLSYKDISKYLRVDSGPLIVNAYDSKGILLARSIINARIGNIYSVALNSDGKDYKLSSFFDNSTMPSTGHFLGTYYKFSSNLSRLTVQLNNEYSDEKDLISFGTLEKNNALRMKGHSTDEHKIISEVIRFFGEVKNTVSTKEEVIQALQSSENIVDIFEFNDIDEENVNFDGRYFSNEKDSVNLVIVKSKIDYDNAGCIIIEKLE